MVSGIQVCQDNTVPGLSWAVVDATGRVLCRFEAAIDAIHAKRVIQDSGLRTLKPRLDQWNPIAQAGPVSCLDVHSVTASPAVTIDPPSTAVVGALERDDSFDADLDDLLANYCPICGGDGCTDCVGEGASGWSNDLLPTDPAQSGLGGQTPWSVAPRPNTTPHQQVWYGRPAAATPLTPYTCPKTGWPTSRSILRSTANTDQTEAREKETPMTPCGRCHRPFDPRRHVCREEDVYEDRIANAQQRTREAEQRREQFERQISDLQARERALWVDDADIAFKLAVGHERAVDEQRQADHQRNLIDRHIRAQVRRREESEAAQRDATLSVDAAFNEFRTATRSYGRR
jgi:hypothetical protein